jgi:hypothetical protein
MCPQPPGGLLQPFRRGVRKQHGGAFPQQKLRPAEADAGITPCHQGGAAMKS